MKTKFLLVFLSVVMYSHFCRAYDFKVDGIYYSVISDDNKTVEVTRNSDVKYDGKIDIPAQVTKAGVTYTVTRIGEMAFFTCTGVTSVSIPESVDSINVSAFHGCKNLLEINVVEANSYFKSIDGVLFDKPGKVLLRFPDAKSTEYIVPDGVNKLASFSFGSNSLRKLSLSVSVLSIEFAAIDCDNLSELNLSTSLEIIGSQSIRCPAAQSIILPESLKSIGSDAFNGSGFESIFIPKSVEYIDENVAIGYCEDLEKIEVDNNNPYYASINGILYNKSLTKILKCPSKIKDMEWITLPETIESICTSAFHSNKSLSRIILPSTIKEIGNGAFYYCTNLNRVVCKSTKPPYTPTEEYTSSDPWEYSSRSSATLIVPKGCIDTYKNYYNIDFHGFPRYSWASFKSIEEIDDGTKIDNLLHDDSETKLSYSISGTRQSALQKGINLIKTEKGSVKKVITK